jgi:hypothetical protein
MARILYDTSTGKTHLYPRADDAPIVGLDPALVALQVIREPMPQPGEGFSIAAAAPVDDLEAGTRTYGWIVEKLPDPDPEPQWVAFGTALVPDPAVNALVAAAATNAPVLHGMLIVGLGQAAQGDSQTFGAAWTAARGAGLVSAELIEHMQQTAGAFNLPEEFIAGLAA